MNILSLFDGISCGQIALERACIKIDNYYSSEIDNNAIKVTQYNYPNTIQIGDVTKIKYKDNKLYTEKGIYENKIDLLIGGSPCQGFSNAGKMLNFKDERSMLFFEYVRLLNEVKPKYFLLENVKMKKEWQDIITRHLGVEPIEINSSLVSGQNRVRLYWTNIPNVKPPQDKKIMFKDIISKDRKWFSLLPWCFKKWGDKIKLDTLRTLEDDKSFCVTTGKTHSKNYYLNRERNMMTKLNANEVELLQTIPIGYTNVLAETQRFKCIGNAWTVDVIAHIFSFLGSEKE